MSMGHKTLVSSRQLLWGVILCLVCNSLISPAAGAARLPAWGRILAAAISAAVVWLLLRPFMKTSCKERFVALLAGYGRGGKFCLVLFCLCFALAAGRGLERTETFYRYVSSETLPLAVFVVLLLAICLYAARCGLETLLRVGLVLLVLTAASLALVLAGNAGQMRLENLQLPRQPVRLAMESLAAGFSVAPELLLLGVFAHSAPRARPASLLVRALTAAVAVDLVLACAVELALGQFGALQVQPLHTLARIGSISVFRRLDAVHVSVWLLAAAFRTALLCAGLGETLRPLLPAKIRRQALWLAAVPVLAAAAAGYFLPEWLLGTVQTALVLAAAFAPVFFCKGGKSHEENAASAGGGCGGAAAEPGRLRRSSGSARTGHCEGDFCG